MELQSPLTAIQVKTLAIAGLGPHQTAPFVRVLYKDSKSSTKHLSRVVAFESRVSSSYQGSERNGRYTRQLIVDDAEAVFFLPPFVDWMEVQVWNQFTNGFDVFLGTAVISIKHLQKQCEQSQAVAKEPKKNPEVHNTNTLSTAPMWFPLQMSKDAGLAYLDMSIHLVVIFVYDTKRAQIYQQNADSVSTTTKIQEEDDFTTDGLLKEKDAKTAVDPTFTFTKPFLQIEWSEVVSTSIRHLFFHGDVERLSCFRECVLYGDIAHELEDDSDVHIHQSHAAAFQLAQLSAQYLDHCVNTLSRRCDEYRDQYRILADMRKKLSQKRHQLKESKQRLQNEHDDLDLLATTYQRMMEKEGLTNEAPASNSPSKPTPQESGGVDILDEKTFYPRTPVVSSGSTVALSPSSPTNTSQKKPTFLMTWEERERERKLEKELLKAQRIEEEKHRLEQLFQDRAARDEYNIRLSKLAEKVRYRAAKTIQSFFQRSVHRFQKERYLLETCAAVRIQAQVRRWLHFKLFLHLQRHRQEHEVRLMMQNEDEMRHSLKTELEATNSVMVLLETTGNHDYSDRSDVTSLDASPAKQNVDVLTATWEKLRQTFLLAQRRSIMDYRSLYSKLDLRQNGVVDRASLRLGLREFGINIDRKLTRALIALVRAKCGDSSPPLHVTFDHFIHGFDLPISDAETNRSNTATEAVELQNSHEFTRRSPGRDMKDRSFTETKTMDHYSSDEDETLDEAVTKAIRTLRKRIVDAATDHLISQGKSTSNYFAFRDALQYVFEEFDVDRDGVLDMDEFVECVQSINFQVTPENLELLRECFACDQNNDRISIAEFISFALTRPSHDEHGRDEKEMGIVGYRIRTALLDRVANARKHTKSIEEAVRVVFQDAYKLPTQTTCSTTVFIKALMSLNLGIKPAQLARLVLQLDSNNDRFISLDELLVWLRLGSSTLRSRGEIVGSPQRTANTENIRNLLHYLAKLQFQRISPSTSHSHVPIDELRSNTQASTSLFHEIDSNNSGKINQDELKRYLSAQDYETLNTILFDTHNDKQDLLDHSIEMMASTAARCIMYVLDTNSNGVVTLNEWLDFLLQSDKEKFARIEAVRTELREIHSNDDQQLLNWFHSLPGMTRMASGNETMEPLMKIRINEFKVALRQKLGKTGIPLRAIEESVKHLDADKSGWITTRGLLSWAFPPRDLEEILHVVIQALQTERHKQLGLNLHDFASKLYDRFDEDRNGFIAQKEVRSGFLSLRVTLQNQEASLLIKAFDEDKDWCWRRAEFENLVRKLLPGEDVSTSDPNKRQIATMVLSDDGENNSSVSDQVPDNDSYESNDFSLSSSSSHSMTEASPPAATGVDYSADFDMDE